MQQPTSSEPRRTQADRAVDRYKALRKLRYQHAPSVYQTAREFGLDPAYIQRELALRSASHRHNEARKAAQPASAPLRPSVRPETAPASSVPVGDR